MGIINYRGYVIKVEQDDYAESCRKWDNLSMMVCSHRRYNLGDKHNINFDDFSSWGDVETYLYEEKDAVEVLPLYLYDHSGITMNTTGFSSSWDSGQVGLVYTTKKRVKEWLGDHISADDIREHLVNEVEVYDMYLRGDVYGYEIEDADGESVGSCWGFYGDPEADGGLLDEAKRLIDYEIEEANKKWSCIDFNQLASLLV